MPQKRSWSDEELRTAVLICKSYRAVILSLRLVPAGGNYVQVQRRVKELGLSTEHFTGSVWNAGLNYLIPSKPLSDVLVNGGKSQSFVLKKRLFVAGLKKPECEQCGWAEKTSDGRIPVELDHINGDRYDNRLENLRILCPNCHSLQPTHRGKNKKVRLKNARVL